MRQTSVSQSDYFRKILLESVKDQCNGEKLVQLRLFAQLLESLHSVIPKFATAFCSWQNAREIILEYGYQSEYQASYENGVPHAVQFVDFINRIDVPAWCQDLARVELWKTVLISQELASCLEHIKSVCQAHDHTDGKTYVIVRVNVNAILQAIDGYLNTTMAKAAQLLWLTGFDPVKLEIEAEPMTSLVLFEIIDESNVGLQFVLGEAQ